METARILFLVNIFIVHTKMQGEEKSKRVALESTNNMSFLKSFCGREFVNKNGNLHRKSLLCLRANNSVKYAQRVKVQFRVRKNIYLNEIRSFTIAWNNFRNTSFARLQML